ncbi:tyrosine-type recombinase/integrase (plasmid) [Natrinema zhouii]|uniref:tyrosine-type recombinase/integrase n=1 Tax=Natrinema zhouii TaxID=1710539 RepID=UPI001CFFE535|nr:tyrosine-type recombinase/integrase [Natrinema zhouii]UHQ98123.1 tyrosine-type recombinase/integrase [Natrinema zhouii]
MIASEDTFIEECKERRLAASTIESHTTALTLYSQWLDTTELEAETVTGTNLREFVVWLKHNWEQPYNEIRNTVFWSLTRYYGYLAEEGRVTTNPCENVDVVECLVLDEATKFLRRVRATKAKTTIQTREYGLILFSEWLERDPQSELVEVEPLDLEDYAIYLTGKGYSNGTVIDRYSTVSTLLTFLHEKEKSLDENPADDVNLDKADIVDYKQPSRKSEELKEEIFYITSEQKDLLLENVPSPTIRNELMIELMWQTGMRRQEVVDLRISDLNRDEGYIDVRGKNGKNRTVFYQSDLSDRLNIWLDGGLRNSSMYAEESPYIFLTEQSEQLHPQQINRTVLQAAEAAGIQETMYIDANGNPRHKITPHGLRHGFAVQSLKNGMDIKNLADIMGHNSLDTTKEYLRFTKEDLKRAYRKFGPGGTAES